jgi:phospholipase/carboxylesterase
MLSGPGLSYIRRLPLRGNPAHPPIVLLLHGFALYEQQLFDMSQVMDPRFVLIAPRGPLRIGPGAYRWFYFDRTPSDGPIINVAEETESLKTLKHFIDGITAEYAPSRFYLFGHSQGGTMALSIALTAPDKIDGCAQAHGRILPKSLASVSDRDRIARVPFFIGHGVENPIVPIKLGRATRDQLLDVGATVSYREYPLGHEMTPDIVADASGWLTAQLDCSI